MSALAPELVRNQTGNGPPMWHALDPQREGYALCGKKLVTVVRHLPREKIECVVCAEMLRV